MDFTWGIFLSKNKINQTNVLELKVISYILINHLNNLLLKGFGNQDNLLFACGCYNIFPQRMCNMEIQDADFVTDVVHLNYSMRCTKNM